MKITSAEFISRVRAHLNADEVAVQNWIPDSSILSWVNTAVLKLWRRLALAGRQANLTVSNLTPTAGVLTLGSSQNEPLCIQSVHDVSTSQPRALRLAQFDLGPGPELGGVTGSTPVWWTAAYSATDDGQVDITLHPAPTSGTFRVRWVRRPDRLVETAPGAGEATSLFVPNGLEEYLVLQAVRLGFARETSMPPSVQRMLDEYEAELSIAQSLFLRGAAVVNRDRELRGWRRSPGSVVQPTDWWWAP